MDSVRFTCAEQVDLLWYTEHRGHQTPMQSVFHGVPVGNNKVAVIQTNWEMTTHAASAGIAMGTLVEHADYTVWEVFSEREHLWILIATLRATLGVAFARSRKLVSDIRAARPGWIKEGWLDMSDRDSWGVWVTLAHNKRFHDWEAKGFFSSTTARFTCLDEFMAVTLDPRARDLSDLVDINVKALTAGLRLSPPVRMRYARRAIRPGARNAEPLAVPELVPAAYQTMSAPIAQAPGLAPQHAMEPELPRTRVLSPDGSGYEDPNDSSTWIMPEGVRAALEEGERKATQAQYQQPQPEAFIPFDENHPLAIAQRQLIADNPSQPVAPAPKLTFWNE